MKRTFLKNFIVLICFALGFSILSPSLAQASEFQDNQITSSLSQETHENNEAEKEEYINDYFNSGADFQGNILDEESSVIDQSKVIESSNLSVDQAPEERIWFRLAFTVAKVGINYIVKTTSKGNVIKKVRNDKLEINPNDHINAGKRFDDKYGNYNMDTLMNYIVEDIRRVDDAELAKEGWNSIKTHYGKKTGYNQLEIRFYVKDGELQSFNAFPEHSTRDAGNVMWIVSQ